uniref:Uncharacterized protein n=2 Tax=Prymnesium polylepis TaxID=72548 RepID=A0A7S4JEZ2_9EUKA
MPTSWDDVLASLAEGFSVNPLTWEDFVNCMKNANWDRYWFVYLVSIIMTSGNLLMLIRAMQRDEAEIQEKLAILSEPSHVMKRLKARKKQSAGSQAERSSGSRDPSTADSRAKGDNSMLSTAVSQPKVSPSAPPSPPGQYGISLPRAGQPSRPRVFGLPNLVDKINSRVEHVAHTRDDLEQRLGEWCVSSRKELTPREVAVTKIQATARRWMVQRRVSTAKPASMRTDAAPVSQTVDVEAVLELQHESEDAVVARMVAARIVELVVEQESVAALEPAHATGLKAEEITVTIWQTARHDTHLAGAAAAPSIERSSYLDDASSVAKRQIAWQHLRSHATETGQNSILVKSWHHDSRQVKARLKLAFLQQHSVLAPTMHSGSVGFTRTQTVMLLFNTASVEIVVLAMQYEPPDDSGENPIVMLAESTFAMVFATSSAWLFAFFFEPQEAIGIAKALFRIICCAPCVVRDALREVKQKQESWRKASETSTEPPPTPPPSPPDAQDGRGDDMQSQSEPTPLTWHGRDFSNESLEYLISRSFRRQWRKKPVDRRQLCKITFGWAANWLAYILCHLIFIAYGCTFAGDGADGSEATDSVTYTTVVNGTSVNVTNGTSGADEAAEYFLNAWAISMGERLLLVEPIIILVVFFAPICFSSGSCSFLCSESIAHAIGVGVGLIVRGEALARGADHHPCGLLRTNLLLKWQLQLLVFRVDCTCDRCGRWFDCEGCEEVSTTERAGVRVGCNAHKMMQLVKGHRHMPREHYAAFGDSRDSEIPRLARPAEGWERRALGLSVAGATQLKHVPWSKAGAARGAANRQ